MAVNDDISFGELKGLRLQSDVLMDRYSGKNILDNQHLRNSIIDILTTPLGSRVMLRDYGTKLFQLIDHPVNRDFIVELYSTIHLALDKWEPRLIIDRIKVDVSLWNQGKISLDLEARYRLENGPVRINDLSLDFMAQNQYFIEDPENLRANPSAITLETIANS